LAGRSKGCISSESSEGNNYHGYVTSIRQQVFCELKKNPSLTPKILCAILQLPWPQYQNYVKSLRFEWQRNYDFERGSNGCLPDDVKRCFYVLRVPRGLVREGVERFGWVRSRARNRFLLWREGLGRVRWFETGTVELYVRRPASREKAVRLFCNAFTRTCVIPLKSKEQAKVLEDCLRTLHVRSAKATWDLGIVLPYRKITLFKGSNGITVLTGDKSDRTCLHIIFEYLQQFERLDRLEEILSDLLQPTPPKSLQRGDSDYVF
jgi:hypothetical protein